MQNSEIAIMDRIHCMMSRAARLHEERALHEETTRAPERIEKQGHKRRKKICGLRREKRPEKREERNEALHARCQEDRKRRARAADTSEEELREHCTDRSIAERALHEK